MERIALAAEVSIPERRTMRKNRQRLTKGCGCRSRQHWRCWHPGHSAQGPRCRAGHCYEAELRQARLPYGSRWCRKRTYSSRPRARKWARRQGVGRDQERRGRPCELGRQAQEQAIWCHQGLEEKYPALLTVYCTIPNETGVHIAKTIK